MKKHISKCLSILLTMALLAGLLPAMQLFAFAVPSPEAQAIADYFNTGRLVSGVGNPLIPGVAAAVDENDGNTVIVSGAFTTGTRTAPVFAIPAGITVVWRADISTSSTAITVNGGSGAFKLVDGGKLSTSATALFVSGNASADVLFTGGERLGTGSIMIDVTSTGKVSIAISGGTFTANNQYIRARAGSDVTVNISGGRFGTAGDGTIVYGDAGSKTDINISGGVMNTGNTGSIINITNNATNPSATDITITGGEMTAGGHALNIACPAKIDISGGVITNNNSRSVLNFTNNADVVVSGGKLTSDGPGGARVIQQSGGTASVTGSILITGSAEIVGRRTTGYSEATGVYASSSGFDVRMEGGSITLDAESALGSVYGVQIMSQVTPFVMTGGAITLTTGSTSSGYGISGVYRVKELHMSGGTITVNAPHATGSVTGVGELGSAYQYGGEMSGGTITVNAPVAPTVYGLQTGADFTMSGGAINVQGNGANVSGVRYNGGYSFLMSGGTITAKGVSAVGAWIYRGGNFHLTRVWFTGGTVYGDKYGIYSSVYPGYYYDVLIAYLSGVAQSGPGGQDVLETSSGISRMIEVDSLNIPVTWDGTSTGLTSRDWYTHITPVWDMSGDRPVIYFGISSYNVRKMEWGEIDYSGGNYEEGFSWLTVSRYNGLLAPGGEATLRYYGPEGAAVSAVIATEGGAGSYTVTPAYDAAQGHYIAKWNIPAGVTKLVSITYSQDGQPGDPNEYNYAVGSLVRLTLTGHGTVFNTGSAQIKGGSSSTLNFGGGNTVTSAVLAPGLYDLTLQGRGGLFFADLGQAAAVAGRIIEVNTDHLSELFPVWPEARDGGHGGNPVSDVVFTVTYGNITANKGPIYLPAGTEARVSATLSRDQSALYYKPDNLAVSVTPGGQLIVPLTRLPAKTFSGRVVELVDDGAGGTLEVPVTGAKLQFSWSNNNFGYTGEAVTRADGSYTFGGFDLPTVITVSADRFESNVYGYPSASASASAPASVSAETYPAGGTLVLRRVRGEVSLRSAFSTWSQGSETPYYDTILYSPSELLPIVGNGGSFQGLTAVVQRRAGGAWKDVSPALYFTRSRPDIKLKIFEGEREAAGEYRIRYFANWCADAYSETFSLDLSHQAEIVEPVELYTNGALHVWTRAVESYTCAVFAPDGRRVTNLDNLIPGTYTIQQFYIVPRTTYQSNLVSVGDVTALGLVKGADYLESTVVVAHCLRKTIEFDTSASRVLRQLSNADFSAFDAARTSLTIDAGWSSLYGSAYGDNQSALVNFTYAVTEGLPRNLERIELLIPAGNFSTTSVRVDGQPLKSLSDAEWDAGSRLLILKNIGAKEGVITFSFVPTGSAYQVNFYCYVRVVGATFNYQEVYSSSVDLPMVTISGKPSSEGPIMSIGGYAKPGATVTVHQTGVGQIGTFRSGINGGWGGFVTVDAKFDPSTVTLYATAEFKGGDGNMASATSGQLRVRVGHNAPRLKDIVLYQGSLTTHIGTMFLKNPSSPVAYSYNSQKTAEMEILFEWPDGTPAVESDFVHVTPSFDVRNFADGSLHQWGWVSYPATYVRPGVWKVSIPEFSPFYKLKISFKVSDTAMSQPSLMAHTHKEMVEAAEFLAGGDGTLAGAFTGEMGTWESFWQTLMDDPTLLEDGDGGQKTFAQIYGAMPQTEKDALYAEARSDFGQGGAGILADIEEMQEGFAGLAGTLDTAVTSVPFTGTEADLTAQGYDKFRRDGGMPFYLKSDGSSVSVVDMETGIKTTMSTTGELAAPPAPFRVMSATAPLAIAATSGGADWSLIAGISDRLRASANSAIALTEKLTSSIDRSIANLLSDIAQAEAEMAAAKLANKNTSWAFLKMQKAEWTLASLKTFQVAFKALGVVGYIITVIDGINNIWRLKTLYDGHAGGCLHSSADLGIAAFCIAQALGSIKYLDVNLALLIAELGGAFTGIGLPATLALIAGQLGMSIVYEAMVKKCMQMTKQMISKCEADCIAMKMGDACCEKKDDDNKVDDKVDDGNEDIDIDQKPNLDPAGVIYEAVLSNPIEGATATVWYSPCTDDEWDAWPDILNDIYVNGNMARVPADRPDAVRWEDVDLWQRNPQITGPDGIFAWDVPNGWWKVTADKEDYLSGESIWLPVPPEQFDVHIGLVSLEAPTAQVFAYADRIDVAFGKYMKSEDLNDFNITVRDAKGGLIDVEFVLADEEEDPNREGVTFTRTLQIGGAFAAAASQTGGVTLWIDGNIQSYAGVSMGQDMTDSYKISDLGGIPSLSLPPFAVRMNETALLRVRADNAEGKTVTLSGFYGYSVSLDQPTAVVTGGTATFIVTGLLSGDTPVTASLAGGSIQAQGILTVSDPAPRTKTAAPSVGKAVTEGGIVVTLSCATSGAVIFYAQGGLDPLLYGKQYTAPFGVFEATTLRVAAKAEGFAWSGVTELELLPDGTAPAITTVSLPGGTVGSSYRQTLAATGTAPITWSLADGNLPGGLSLSPDGVISGMPTTSGTFNFTVQASNPTGDATMALRITISAGGSPYTPPGEEDTVPDDDKPPLAEPWENPYTDVADADWFYDAVRAVTEKGLMLGIGLNRFAPGRMLSRSEIVTILYRLEGKPAVTGDMPFPDVRAGQWYSNAILWAYRQGIVFGYGNGNFGPGDPITREGALTVLYRYAKTKGLDVSAGASVDLSQFTDMGEISNWALDAVKWAVAVGIVQGRPDSKVAPVADTTRAEIAMIFKRYLDDFLGDGDGDDVS